MRTSKRLQQIYNDTTGHNLPVKKYKMNDKAYKVITTWLAQDPAMVDIIETTVKNYDRLEELLAKLVIKYYQQQAKNNKNNK